MRMTVESATGTDVTGGIAARLKVLGEPTRLEIVRRLAAEDLCPCHLVADLGIAQPLVSHHLRVLREAGILRSEPAGAFTYYVLVRPVMAEIAELLGDLAQEARPKRRRPCT